MHHDAYPLPRIDATLNSFAASTHFTTLDLASDYWQVEVEEQGREKAAFSTPKGHLEFNVMPFVLTNAPATLQCLIDCVLAGLAETQCLIYIDDIIVFSRSFLEHIHHLVNAFKAIRGTGLQLKPGKCHFTKREVNYLGNLVSAAGVLPDPAKTEAVSSYPTPKDAKELRQLLRLSNYYHRFVANYSKIAEPLLKLLRKKRKFHWGPSCQESLDTLKQSW